MTLTEIFDNIQVYVLGITIGTFTTFSWVLAAWLGNIIGINLKSPFRDFFKKHKKSDDKEK